MQSFLGEGEGRRRGGREKGRGREKGEGEGRGRRGGEGEEGRDTRTHTQRIFGGGGSGIPNQKKYWYIPIFMISIYPSIQK